MQMKKIVLHKIEKADFKISIRNIDFKLDSNIDHIH